MSEVPPTQPEGGVFFSESPDHQKETPSRSRVLKFALITAGVFIALFAVAVAYEAFFSPRAVGERETQRNYEIAKKGLEDFREKMTADTYGGKTPQETLDMFIAALEKNDIELASKYAWWDGGSASIANKEALVEGLEQAQREGKLSEVIDILKKMEFLDDINKGSNDSKWFGIKDSNGIIEYSVVFRRNNFSQVWKIESI